LRAPVRKLDNAELHRVSLDTYQRCLEMKGTPGVAWDADFAKDLWDETIDPNTLWMRLVRQTLH